MIRSQLMANLVKKSYKILKVPSVKTKRRKKIRLHLIPLNQTVRQRRLDLVMTTCSLMIWRNPYLSTKLQRPPGVKIVLSSAIGSVLRCILTTHGLNMAQEKAHPLGTIR
jgi:hypothetical protein